MPGTTSLDRDTDLTKFNIQGKGNATKELQTTCKQSLMEDVIHSTKSTKNFGGETINKNTSTQIEAGRGIEHIKRENNYGIVCYYVPDTWLCTLYIRSFNLYKLFEVNSNISV